MTFFLRNILIEQLKYTNKNYFESSKKQNFDFFAYGQDEKPIFTRRLNVCAWVKIDFLDWCAFFFIIFVPKTSYFRKIKNVFLLFNWIYLNFFYDSSNFRKLAFNQILCIVYLLLIIISKLIE